MYWNVREKWKKKSQSYKQSSRNADTTATNILILITSLASINQLAFVAVKSCIFFGLGTETFLFYLLFSFKGLIDAFSKNIILFKQLIFLVVSLVCMSQFTYFYY